MMNTDVLIAGIGQTSVGEHWDISLRELAFTAMEAAIQDAAGMRPDALFVSNLLAPMVSGQAHLGALLADFAGLRGIEATTIEGAGASGGAALRAGYLAVKSGFVDAALVVGVEKITDKVPEEVDEALSATLDSDYEAIHGVTPFVQAALLMQRYLHESEATREAFGGFPAIAHDNGARNPHAMFQMKLKPGSYSRAPLIYDPLNMFDTAPDADGAAAILLTRSELLPDTSSANTKDAEGRAPVRISASSMATDTLAIHDRPDPIDFRAARYSVEKAIYQAGITLDQVNFFELSDTTTIHAVLSLEAAGFSQRGQGWRLAQDGRISLEGFLPISTFGGLKARGNPWGATGVYQAVEAVLQLRNQAGEVQVPNARFGMVQCLGGAASTAVTHILEAIV
jgi:acetyl-CoA C-acetyltransferase